VTLAALPALAVLPSETSTSGASISRAATAVTKAAAAG
jgi:hypothetical protein